MLSRYGYNLLFYFEVCLSPASGSGASRLCRSGTQFCLLLMLCQVAPPERQLGALQPAPRMCVTAVVKTPTSWVRREYKIREMDVRRGGIQRPAGLADVWLEVQEIPWRMLQTGHTRKIIQVMH